MKLPTINIKGKEYVMVKDRVVAFNQFCPEGSIVTEIVKNDDKSVVVKASVYPDLKEKRIFVGHSEAYRNAGQMGQVPVEVAETSAVGRALAMMGIGIVDGIASADEVVKSEPSAFKKATPKQVAWIKKLALEKGQTVQTDNLDMSQASKLIEELNNTSKPDTSNFDVRDFVD